MYFSAFPSCTSTFYVILVKSNQNLDAKCGMYDTFSGGQKCLFVLLKSPSLQCSLLPFTDKTIKLWKISERDKRPEGYNLKEDDGRYKDPNTITSLRVSTDMTRK